MNINYRVQLVPLAYPIFFFFISLFFLLFHPLLCYQWFPCGFFFNLEKHHFVMYKYLCDVDG